MPYPTDESDTNTLPDPELNPLLNPLLAAHMGRWAEVYFTSPPEKREEAVAELIRELKNSSPSDPAPIEAIEIEEERKKGSAEVPGTAHAADPHPTCRACGYKNSAEQKFCGMCGALLQIMPESPPLQVAEIVPKEATRSEPFRGDSGEYAIQPVANSPADGGSDSDDDQDSTWSLPENELPHFAVEPEHVPYRYRLYVGVVLAILLSVLVYMAWRGTKAISATAGPRSAPSRVIPPAPAPVASAPQPTATPVDSSENNAPTSALAAKSQQQATPRKNRTAPAQPASRIVTKAASTSAIAAEPSGAEDLATAENYLNGTQGRTRDSREAALWLWKAVGKGNPAATMALSDLYLRGDGVPKSCDQARLLLDAAARKGARAAAERLRNLQAFGCQ